MPGQAVISIDGNQWTVEVASTQTELMTGLAGRTSLTPGTGMLFILPSAQQVTVTTQNMLFPIDIIFIANNTVLDVASNIQPGYDVTEETPCDSFLEVNAGEAAGVSQGDTVTVEYLYNIVGDINAWIPSIISLLGLGIIGTFLAGMFKTVTRAMLGKPKESQAKLLPQTERTLKVTKPTRYDVSVDSWVERDRIGIWITDLRTSKTIAEWWDDKARAMFDEGFFKPATFTRSGELGGREFIESVLDYAESVGLLAKEGSTSERPPALIPVEPRKRKERGLEYMADSPEFLTQTIDDIGYRDKLGKAFREAIARAKGLKS